MQLSDACMRLGWLSAAACFGGPLTAPALAACRNCMRRCMCACACLQFRLLVPHGSAEAQRLLLDLSLTVRERGATIVSIL